MISKKAVLFLKLTLYFNFIINTIFSNAFSGSVSVVGSGRGIGRPSSKYSLISYLFFRSNNLGKGMNTFTLDPDMY